MNDQASLGGKRSFRWPNGRSDKRGGLVATPFILTITQDLKLPTFDPILPCLNDNREAMLIVMKKETHSIFADVSATQSISSSGPDRLKIRGKSIARINLHIHYPRVSTLRTVEL
ncbi:hypothetical protein KM043_009711 [Ampulex compressa]|nr:hypothetical protein KM043_009711 [Ampulex compressa]